MSGTTEAFARVRIDALLQDAGWNLTDGSSVLFEHALPDGTQADYVLCDRQGRPMAVLEAKRASIDPVAAQDQGRHYAAQLGVPFVFLSEKTEAVLLDGLTRIADETSGGVKGNDIDGVIATRAAAARLALSLFRRLGASEQELPQAIRRWRDICGMPDEFAEIRNAWEGASDFTIN